MSSYEILAKISLLKGEIELQKRQLKRKQEYLKELIQEEKRARAIEKEQARKQRFLNSLLQDDFDYFDDPVRSLWHDSDVSIILRFKSIHGSMIEDDEF